jgi:hypothetical protein
MTERVWRVSGKPLHMLVARGEKLGSRKLRLFACACCRRAWGRLTPRHRKAVELAERYSDREVTKREWAPARRALLPRASSFSAADDAIGYALHNDALTAAKFTAGNASALAVEEVVSGPMGAMLRYSGKAEDAESRQQAALLRCIAGARYRLPRIKSAWLTSDVVALARGIYEGRAFDRMPILADALQEAGCDNSDILSHCRDTKQTHARGCWVVDLVLGKE